VGVMADAANIYVCAVCKGVFEKGWTDEEAIEEFGRNFDPVLTELEIVCDDCYQACLPDAQRNFRENREQILAEDGKGSN
jgi:hypothetical protein